MNRKISTIFIFLICVNTAIFAQITDTEKKLKTLETDKLAGWKKGAVMGANFSQTALVNWSAGGESSLAVNGLVSLFANYKNKNTAWDNSLDMGYGLLNQGSNGYIKTDDRFDLLSKYGKKAFSNFYYAALLNFKTQFTAGYNYPNDSVKISNFMAPAYLLGAIGMNYQPNAYFNAFLAPFTAKMTIVNDELLSAAGAFGLTPGDKVKSEYGGYARVIYSRNNFQAELFKNVAFTTKIDLFSNYLNNPQNVDVSWETQIAMKVNKYLSVNLNTHLMYDADIKINGGPAKVQFKEILGVGFSVKM